MLFLAIAALLAPVADANTIFVIAPLAVGMVGSLGFLWHLCWRQYPVIPWFEIGVMYMAAVTLYMTLPMIGYLVLDGIYSPASDGRLANLNPTAEDIGAIGWLYAAHLVSFAVTYVVVRGRLVVQPIVRLRPPRLTIVVATFIVYVSLQLFTLAVAAFYNLASSNYLESYAAVRVLPQFIAQLYNHLGGAKYTVSVALLAALFTRYETSKALILLWVLFTLAVTVGQFGSRTEFVLLAMAAAMMYHKTVQPLRPWFVMSAAAAGLLLFVAFGMARNQIGFWEGQQLLNPLAVTNEFESIFVNALHLNIIKLSIGTDVPLAFYLADLAALVPQQLLPFEKIDPAEWYMRSFFPAAAEQGAGLVFGTIAEAVMFGGWIAAALRGAALGFCLAKIHRFYSRHASSFWVFVCYVWMATLTYQLVRNRTFALLVLFVYRVLPIIVAVHLVAKVIRWLMGEYRTVAPGRLAETPSP